MSALVTSEIFRLFLNTLTPDDKYSVAICRLSDNNFKRLYLKKERLFLGFLLNSWYVHEILNILKKKEEYPSLIITEIIASEWDVYLRV